MPRDFIFIQNSISSSVFSPKHAYFCLFVQRHLSLPSIFYLESLVLQPQIYVLSRLQQGNDKSQKKVNGRISFQSPFTFLHGFKKMIFTSSCLCFFICKIRGKTTQLRTFSDLNDIKYVKTLIEISSLSNVSYYSLVL